ncbi:MAG: S-methyl-5'-thioadenosine phosphorylase [Myxococcota bacterium]|nr:S-methyl-5'-thioadenosine phosphorylase [Myxococcota bacterium]
MSNAKIAIIGGSGLYQMNGVTTIQSHTLNTPYGPTSAPITQCRLSGSDAELYFLPRHGIGHTLNPSEVPYRANIFALKSLGVDWIISVSAVGSLQEPIVPGHVVIIDQFIDRTKNRPSTFFDEGIVAHVPFGDPICTVLRNILLVSARETDASIHDGGTYVCMEGPAFSTRAESNLYRSWGASVIGMTNLPEAKLAREAEISYATLAMSTDYDCWHEGHDDVTVDQVIATVKANVTLAQDIIRHAIPKITQHSGPHPQKGLLASAFITDKSKIPAERIEALKPIVGPYLN